MTNARADSAQIVSGGTYTAAAGSNRRLVVAGIIQKDTGTPTWTATFGGVAMTLDSQTSYSNDDKLLVFSMLEAAIPSGSQTLVVTPSGGAALTDFHGAIYTLVNRDQTALDTGFSSNGAGAATTLTTGSLTNAAGSFLLATIRQQSGDLIDARPLFWTQRHTDGTNLVTAEEDRDDAPAATQTYSWESSGTSWIYLTVAYKAIPPGMEAAANDVSTASAALSTQVKLGAAAADSVSSTAAITTAIKLAAAAVNAASATGALNTGATLQAHALGVASAVAALSTGIRLGGSAVDVAVATGALTNWVAVTLAGTLYTGTGGALDPNFWIDSVPQLGTTLYYDATHITIYPNGEISSDVNNCAAVVQFFDGADWALGVIVCTPFMVAYANDLVSASAQFSTAIQLAAAASALATATGAFSTGAGLVADAADTASASGSLSTAIPLSALAADVSAAIAALTAQIRLQANAAAASSATAALNGVAALYATAAAISTATGNLSTGIPLAGSAVDNASLSGSLATGIKLSGSAADVVSAAGALSTAITLAANANSSAQSSASLTAFRPLVAAAIDIVTALATLGTGISLRANATGISQASAALTAAIDLLARADDESTASASLTNIIDSPPIGAYESDPRFYITKSRWSFFPCQRTPRFDAKDPLESVVLTFDLSGLLLPDEYLNGAITLTIATTSGSDASPRSLLIGVPSYDMTKTKILQPVQAGIDRCYYYVKVAAATNKPHRAVSMKGLLPVRS